MKPTIVPAELAGAEPATDSWLQRLGRRLFLGKLAGLTHGELTVIEGAARRRFGKRSADFDLHATIEILHPQTHADVAFGGSTGAGEAYMRGHWRSDDLTSLVRIFIRNRPVLNAIESGSSIATAPLRRILHALNRNSPEGSRRNIAAHYDLGNDLFALFLDQVIVGLELELAADALELGELRLVERRVLAPVQPCRTEAGSRPGTCPVIAVPPEQTTARRGRPGIEPGGGREIPTVRSGGRTHLPSMAPRTRGTLRPCRSNRVPSTTPRCSP